MGMIDQQEEIHCEEKLFPLLDNRPFYSCCCVTWLMAGSEAAGDHDLIQISLLFLCKCRQVCITTTQFT